MSGIKVSVLIPAYNRAHYLCKSVASALSQTLSPVEILIADDGSLDDTVSVLARFERRYPQVKVFHNESNLGVSAARNKILQCAAGEFIAFLDSDDYFASSSFLASAYAMAKADNADMLYFHSIKRIEDKGGYREYIKQEYEVAQIKETKFGLNLENFPRLLACHRSVISYIAENS